MYYRCCVPGCNSLRQDVKLLKFPSNKVRLQLWLKYIKSEDLDKLSLEEVEKSYQVCHKHFESRFKTRKSSLRISAVPTLFSVEEISRGYPSNEAERTIVFQEHNPAQRVLFDHTYANVVVSLTPHGDELADPKPSTSQLTTCVSFPNSPMEETLVIPEHNPAKRIYFDHTYAKIGVPLTQHGDEFADPKPSTSQLTTFEVSFPSSPMEDLSTSTLISDVIQESLPISQSPEPILTTSKNMSSEILPESLPIAPTPVHGNTNVKKRKRIIHKIQELTPKCKGIYRQYVKVKRQFNLKRRNTARRLFKDKEAIENIHSTLNPAALNFISMQYKWYNKPKMARKYTIDEKILALSIYKQSSKSYRFLQKIFVLPSISTLKQLGSKLDLEPGINPKIFYIIKQEVSKWDVKHKYCTIIFDEMALEPGLTYTYKDKITGFVHLKKKTSDLADHALVFMIKGALAKWHQPIAYYFCKGSTSGLELKNILLDVVTAVGDSGLIPTALVSDQGSSFQSTYNMLQSESRRERGNTDGAIYISNYKLYIIYDPPHLIKGIRNNFLNKDIIFNNKRAKWSDIVDVYKTDCDFAENRCMPKLNDEHVFPEKIKKMKVKNCVQVFSSTVAMVLNFSSAYGTYSDGKPISTTLRNTAEVITFFDNLFDSVNGSALSGSPGKELRKAVTQTSKHHDFWVESKEKLKNMKFLNSNNTQKSVPSIKNWVQTINSLQCLWQFFNEKGYFIMRPRYFNSDALENFFGQVRAYNYRSNNPNCLQFENTFKSLLMTGFIKWHDNSFNCEKDFAKQLINIKSLFLRINEVDETNHENNENPQNECVLEDCVTREMNTLEAAKKERLNIQSRAYTTGWVVRKVMENVKCKECKKSLTVEQNQDVHNWIDCREFNKNRRKLIYPSEECIINFGIFLKNTNKWLELYSSQPKISKTIFNSTINQCNFNIQCSHKEEVIKSFVKITIKLGIYNWCNIINRILKGTDIERLKTKSNISFMQRKALDKFNKNKKRKIKK